MMENLAMQDLTSMPSKCKLTMLGAYLRADFADADQQELPSQPGAGRNIGQIIFTSTMDIGRMPMGEIEAEKNS